MSEAAIESAFERCAAAASLILNPARVARDILTPEDTLWNLS
jgi:hypothetical protein